MGVTATGAKVVGGLQPASTSIEAHVLRDRDGDGKVSRKDIVPDAPVLSPEKLGAMIANRPEKYLLLGEAHDAPDPKTVSAVFDELKRKNIPFVYGVEVPSNESFRKDVLKYNDGKMSDKAFTDSFTKLHSDFSGKFDKDAMLGSMIAAHKAGANIALLDSPKRIDVHPDEAEAYNRNRMAQRDSYMAAKLEAIATLRLRNEDGTLRPLLPANGKIVATLGAMHTMENITPSYKQAVAASGGKQGPNPAANLLAARVGKDQVFSALLYPTNVACMNDRDPLGAGAWDAAIPRDVKVSLALRINEAACKVEDSLRK